MFVLICAMCNVLAVWAQGRTPEPHTVRIGSIEDLQG